MTLNPALLGELEKLDPELYQDIYETGFRTCSWPNYLVMGKILETIDKRGIPFRLTNHSALGPYHAYGYLNDETQSDYMETGDSWAEAVLKLYLQILRRK